MKLRFILAVISAALLAGCSQGDHGSPIAATPPATTRLTLLPHDTLAVGKATTVEAKLNTIKTRTIVTHGDLETVHTQPFHLLAIDPTLTDYQHIHPQPTKLRGVYEFSFTPRKGTDYRLWADITPKATGRQEFAMADLGSPRRGAIDKTETHEARADGYRFTLRFDRPPVAGGETMGVVRVTDSAGRPVTSLEPVMGAFGHIVAFHEDLHTVLHTHPMGSGPSSESDRGGPELMFHLAPIKPGFIKLFAQVRIGGRDLFVPFGVNVAPAT